MSSELKGRRRRFVEEYLIDRNGTQAAIRAGYKPDNARKHASRLMTNADIQNAINEGVTRQTQRTEVTADKLIQFWWSICQADLKDAYKENGELKSIHEMSKKTRRAIASIDVDEIKEYEPGRGSVLVGYTKKVKRWDVLKASEMIGRHLKMFTDKVEISGTVSIAEKMKEARERVKKVGQRG